MTTLSEILDRVRGLDLERALGLRPPAPGVALELDRDAVSLVRLRRLKRGAPPALEGHRVERSEPPVVPASIFDQSPLGEGELAQGLRTLFERCGVRPGRVGLVLPDNVAKIALLVLPERPASTRQLVELIRFKMNRAMPFKVADAALSYQILPAEGRAVTVLVALMRQALVDRYERAIGSLGARLGLVDLCTPNLLNLCRARVEQASAAGDVALLNCTSTYFSLLIVRGGRLIFYRCKSYNVGDAAAEAAAPNGLFAREIAGSLSYYREKLDGRTLATVLVRTVAAPFEEIAGKLARLDIGALEPLDPLASLSPGPAGALAPQLAQRLAPALGAALGRA
jgi:hypothetical protein